MKRLLQVCVFVTPFFFFLIKEEMEKKIEITFFKIIQELQFYLNSIQPRAITAQAIAGFGEFQETENINYAHSEPDQENLHESNAFFQHVNHTMPAEIAPEFYFNNNASDGTNTSQWATLNIAGASIPFAEPEISETEIPETEIIQPLPVTITQKRKMKVNKSVNEEKKPKNDFTFSTNILIVQKRSNVRY